MSSAILRRAATGIAAGAALAAVAALGGSPANAAIPDGTTFYTPRPDHGAIRQIATLTADGQKALAGQIRAMVETPQAVWVTGGSGHSLTQSIKAEVQRAAGKKAMPVLVAYNIPFRDCAQYSAGGATSVDEYEAWIDAFAAGIGDHEVAVMLEPDGLGIIPWYTTINGEEEWCKPAEANPATAASDRFAMLNYAVDRLAALPRTSVYLDGTHSAWLGAGDAADRLVRAGVARADGFFLNVSNYQTTERQLKYGNWIAKCIYYGTEGPEWARGHFEWCASQYYPADPDDFATWVPDRRLVRQQRRRRRAGRAGALRRRHQPQRPGPVDPAGRRHLAGPADVVQPAGPRPRRSPDHRHGRPAGRRLPVGQDAGSVRRPVRPGHRHGA